MAAAPGRASGACEGRSVGRQAGKMLNDSAPVPFYCIFLSLWAIRPVLQAAQTGSE